MKATDFEKAVWAIEGVRIVLRVDSDKEVGDYNYKKAADESWRVAELAEKRIDKSLDGIPYTVIQGDGEEPHGKAILRTIRKTYKP